jgi:hypothetical protein
MKQSVLREHFKPQTKATLSTTSLSQNLPSPLTQRHVGQSEREQIFSNATISIEKDVQQQQQQQRIDIKKARSF